MASAKRAKTSGRSGSVTKRNPQDLTLRNLRAMHKRVERLEKDMAEMQVHVIKSITKIMKAVTRGSKASSKGSLSARQTE